MATPQEARQWLTERNLQITPSNINRVNALMAADQIAASGSNAQPDRIAATGNVDRMLGEFDTRSNGSSQRASGAPGARSDAQPSVSGVRPVPTDTRASAARGGSGIVSPPGARNEPQSTQQSAAAQQPVASAAQAPAASPSSNQQIDDGARLLQMLTGMNVSRVPNAPSPAQANIDSTIAASMPESPAPAPGPGAAAILDPLANEAADVRAGQLENESNVYDRGMQALTPGVSTAGQADPMISPGEQAVLSALGLGGAALGGGAALRYINSPTPPVQVGAPLPPRGPRAPPMPASAGPPMPPSMPVAPVQPIPPTGAPRSVQGQVPPNMPPSATVPQSPNAQRIGPPMAVNGGSAGVAPAGGEPPLSNVPQRGAGGMQPSPRGVVNRGTGSVTAPPPATAPMQPITRPAGGARPRGAGQFDRPWWMDTPLR